MEQRRRRLSETEKQAVWTAWVEGASFEAMGASLHRSSSGVGAIVRAAGGIPCPPRQRSRLALTLPERAIIARRVAAGDSSHTIAALLPRAPSTISREIARSGRRRRSRGG